MSEFERERETHTVTQQHNIMHEQWNLPNMETKLLRCFSWNFPSYSTSSLGKPMYCRVQRTDLCTPCLYILSKTNQSFVDHTHKSTHTNASEHTVSTLTKMVIHYKAEIFKAMVWLETSNISHIPWNIFRFTTVMHIFLEA